LETLWVFAVLIKYAVFILFLRFFALFYLGPGMEVSTNFWIITGCMGSLLVGAAGAFLITNIKRFVAYTAINQMGFLFIGLASLSIDGIKATVNYLYIYMLANLLFFCVITLLQFKKQLVSETGLRSLKDLTVIKKAPMEMGLLIIALLSMSGLPPLAGFAGKYVLWISLISQYLQTNIVGLSENLLYILIISVVLSLLSTFYYLRLIKLSLFDNFESGGVLIVEIRSVSDMVVIYFVVGLLGLITVGWFFVLYDLDKIWTVFTLAVIAPFGV
jgi:NADH-quinone oxidoreductase subunit N